MDKIGAYHQESLCLHAALDSDAIEACGRRKNLVQALVRPVLRVMSSLLEQRVVNYPRVVLKSRHSR